MDVETIRNIIQKNNMHSFYGSYEWQRTAKQARADQHNECQRCKRNGFYSPCEIVHHKKHLKDFPELAFDLGNLECLCFACHEEEHAEEEKIFLNEERW